ncbi:ATP-dependent nuclease [Lacticaseibacillus pantheris]|uniref:ATP-dependent nuclease n=1 Tax=Lacticaseibacillus pantheris TaxID=171523 RepID=UPI00265807F0|nr:AAA family ATPase [Lacticaseibacillus pantheris]WKF85917.1 AAA family ATPase [Lacticaseibacillus pantheris]
MFLKNIQLYNFRKFMSQTDEKPGLTIDFHPGLNIMVGENDSGKTAVIDAIKMLLGTISEDRTNIQDEDFYFDGTNFSNSFKIEAVFCSLDEHEAGTFLEWLSFDENNEYELHVRLTVERKTSESGREYLDRNLVAGDEGAESPLASGARAYLRVTYLKALRNAADELTPGFRSHLPQLLSAHSEFRNHPEHKVKIVQALENANTIIEKYLSEGFTSDSDVLDNVNRVPDNDSENTSINNELHSVLSQLFDDKDQDKSETRFQLTQATLDQIFKQLSLSSDSINLGLGNLNLLYISTELALLKDHSGSVTYGPNIMLIEELEAHLHVQAQIRLIKYIEHLILSAKRGSSQQFILTSHSIALTASVDQKSLIYINADKAYSMAPEATMLEEVDYNFLNRFLDATKSNLFFAKGIILVEGYAENILLPTLATLIHMPLYRSGVSIVNVEGTSFKQYIKLFSRQKGLETIHTPISLITDSDIKPIVYSIDSENIEEINKIISEPIGLNNELLGTEYKTFGKLVEAFQLKFVNTNKESLLSKVEKFRSNDDWDAKTSEKQEYLNQQYEEYNANKKVFISPLWTLEYSLLCSPLRHLTIQAIAETRYAEGVRRKSFINQFEEDYNVNSNQAAYTAYEALDKGTVSKTQVSERLAKLITELSSDEKDLLANGFLSNQMDPQNNYCQYLIDAIRFASGMEADQG